MDLNLISNTETERRVKAYLEESASEELAKKINEGVPVNKDGKTLIQKKTLAGFIRYATEEAKKIAEKGASCACVDDNTVFGWAVHYFEEDALEGELFNEDGTPYEKPKPKTVAVPKPAPAPKQKEPTLFDLIEEGEKNKDDRVLDEEDLRMVDEEMEAKGEILIKEPEEQYSKFYLDYLDLQKHNPNVIIAQRIGDFYEIFGEDAETAAKAIDLTLTSRAVGFNTRVPMCGVPYHVMDKYFQQLADIGHFVLANSNENYKVYRKGLKIVTVDRETGEITGTQNEATEPPKDDPLLKAIVGMFKGLLEVRL